MKKVLAAGSAGPKKNPKAPMVDPKGNWTKIQEKTIKTKKKQLWLTRRIGFREQ